MSVFLTHDTRLLTLPAGQGVLTFSSRVEWEWRLLDANRTQVGILDGVTGGSLTWNVNADTRTMGNLSWTGYVDDEPDWLHVLVQPVITRTAVDGSSLSWPMGVYMPAKPAAVHGEDGQVSVELTMYDRTLALRQAKYGTTRSNKRGANLLQIATDAAASVVGYDSVLIPEDAALTSRTMMAWEPGTEYLRRVNDTLDAAGYFALWADGEGYFRSSPYVRPQDRPVVWSFVDGPLSVYGPEVTRTQDLFNAYNLFTAWSRADGDRPALKATAKIPDEHPLSAASRGRSINRVEMDVEASTQAVLQTKVDRWRDESMNPTTTLEISHLPIPLALNDRVNFRRDSAGIDVPGVVETMSIECTPTAMWRTTIREVAA